MSLDSLLDWIPSDVASLVADYLPPQPGSIWRNRFVNTTECTVTRTYEGLVSFVLLHIDAMPYPLSVNSGEFFRLFKPIRRLACTTTTASLPLLTN
jgi:hypothetical protein